MQKTKVIQLSISPERDEWYRAEGERNNRARTRQMVHVLEGNMKRCQRAEKEVSHA